MSENLYLLHMFASSFEHLLTVERISLRRIKIVAI